MKKNKQLLLTKSEFGLLVGGLMFFSALYFTTAESKKNERTYEELASLNYDAEEKITPKPVNRSPAKESKENVNTSPIKVSLLKQAEDCISSKSCDFPNSDPRSYSLSAYSNLADQINEQSSFLVKNWNHEVKNDFERYLRYPNGFVKEAALKTILKLDDKKLLDFSDELAINIIHDHNAELMTPTMEFISRISDSEVRKTS